jgi:predicted small lipoprotein YifL
MSANRRGIVRNLVLAAAVAAVGIACGQRGPLVLPEKARPVQRIEMPQPQPQPPEAPAPEKQDDEQKNER